MLLTLLLGVIPAGCAPSTPSGGDVSHDGIVYYDIAFEMDPTQVVFSSQQRASITGSLAEGRKLSVFLKEGPEIDRLALEDSAGNALAIARWQPVGSTTSDTWWGQSASTEIEIETVGEIPTEEQLTVSLDYHLPEEAIQAGLAENIYDLFVGTRGSHAGGPESGAFLLVSGNLEAPFSITIRHPDTFLCALSGEQVRLEESKGYVTETYRSDLLYDPSFSCAPYHVMSEEIPGMRIDIFMSESVELSPEMLTAVGEIMMLYQENLGNLSAQSFHIVFPEMSNDEGGGESNGNLVILANIQPFLNYDEDETAKDMFANLVAHGGYHLWNAWGLKWEGPLAEWWVEGGASSAASWANEVLYGDKAGAGSRLRYLEDFDETEAYLHKNSLDSLDDSWFSAPSLVYEYGALVWEQLRQALGSEAMTVGLRDFYETYGGQSTSYEVFIACMQEFTAVDVAASLEPWLHHNARVDLIIRDVTLQLAGEGYEVKVEVEVEADGIMSCSPRSVIKPHLKRTGGVSI